MFDGTFQLSATHQLTGTVEVGAFATNFRSTHRAVIWHAKGSIALFTMDRETLGNRGNHIASPFHFDGIADANVFPRHFIGVVQCGSADGDATDLHRFQ
jgi:hypothetical protein